MNHVSFVLMLMCTCCYSIAIYPFMYLTDSLKGMVTAEECTFIYSLTFLSCLSRPYSPFSLSFTLSFTLCPSVSLEVVFLHPLLLPNSFTVTSLCHFTLWHSFKVAKPSLAAAFDHLNYFTFHSFTFTTHLNLLFTLS